MQHVGVENTSLELLAGLLASERADRLRGAAAHARSMLGDRVVWNVNATAQGGGVAEMLQTLLAYERGAGVDTRWLVLDGDPRFFTITKRLHNLLHGDAGDGGPLGADEHAHYERILGQNLATVTSRIRRGDVVVLHDPQTAGLVAGLRASGALVVWRCHVGRDTPDERTELGWSFLRGYVEKADAFIFSRAQYCPDWVPHDRLWVIPPSIDPLSPKNRGLGPAEVRGILRRAGLVAGTDAEENGAIRPFVRRNGSLYRLRRHRDLVLDGAPPPPDARLVVQVSRWDRLKDMTGVLTGFAQHLGQAPDDVHLMLVGPDVSGVSDDPEGAEVVAECEALWHALPGAVRARVHLACLPMDDVDENATIVNALQRHAYVIVQKSLVEGFGLTVTEAMWKARPVLAGAVGGIQDQIDHDHHGLLLPDPRDLEAFADALHRLHGDDALASRLGTAGQARVRDEFIGDRHLIRYVDVLASLLQ
jgi:trehalose synthase